MAGKKKLRSPEAIAKQKATLAAKKANKQGRAGIRQGKVVELVDHRTGDKNPNVLTIAGLRDYVAFEVKRLLPEVVAAEMAKRFGGGS